MFKIRSVFDFLIVIVFYRIPDYLKLFLVVFEVFLDAPCLLLEFAILKYFSLFDVCEGSHCFSVIFRNFIISCN